MESYFDSESQIIWRGKLELDEEVLSKVYDEMISREELKTTRDSGLGVLYTTFFHDDIHDRPEIAFLDDYKKLVEDMVYSLGLYESENEFDYWCQVYDGSHSIHSHWSPIVTVSFVHFVRPTEKKCFYFVTKDVGKLYPKQDPGDVIAFPSWTPHGVDESYGNERLTIAGNIMVRVKKSPTEDFTAETTVVRKGLYITELYDN